MITVHLIFNAHLDPVWMWPWTSGLDAALSTCRTAADLLEAHPDVTFTLGDAWVYEQVERCEPDLLGRIQCLHAEGRWDLAGGWWIQPDCNLPTAAALRKQIDLGRRYFERVFGAMSPIACNVDSFGHAGSMPTILRQAGQDAYAFLRPKPHEMALPARLFRWRSAVGDDEVVALRIPHEYQSGLGITAEHIQAALTDLPPGIEHTASFIGVGDHGGGPTARQIDWCRAHADALPGCRLEFSTLPRFFDAIRPQVAQLPIHVGELQMHAVGCYSVYRPVKVGARRAEHRLAQAEVALAADPRPDEDAVARTEAAWRRVCFGQFHDTLGGTCLPSAYEIVNARLGEALATADELLHHALRRQLSALPDDARQRVVWWNAADEPFDGWATCEPWLVGTSFQPQWRLLDERGDPVAFQLLDREVPSPVRKTVLMRLRLRPGELRVLRIEQCEQDVGDPPPSSRLTAGDDAIASPAHVSVTADGTIHWVEAVSLTPTLHLLDDPSDTWSHDIDRYAAEPAATARWDAPEAVDTGPLMAGLIQTGRIGDSLLRREWRVFDDESWVELRLNVNWRAQQRALKLVIQPSQPIARRVDGIPGGALERQPDGVERPLHDWTLLGLAGGAQMGIVCPEVFALDANADRVRLTLLRSPQFGHHDPLPAEMSRPRHTDQGEHEFSIWFRYAPQLDAETLARHARNLQRPPLMADLTRGMRPYGILR